jgi:enoyl-CoA hydratase/carnithine racemase
MEYTDILYDVEDDIATITLNRPEKLNAWTDAMAREYRDALGRAERDSAVRAIILTGAGRGFCAGADMGMLNVIANNKGETTISGRPPEATGIEANYQQAQTWPLASGKPLIGAINGPAVGLGLVHTLYCDMRFASENARFGTAFATLGLVAEHGGSWLLPRLVGMANALDLLYSARIIGAEEAREMGLVTRVFPADQLLEGAREYIHQNLARSSPAAMAEMKRLVWDAQFTDLAAAVKAADAAMQRSFQRPDFKEGLNAFAEKRAPRYAGIGD